MRCCASISGAREHPFLGRQGELTFQIFGPLGDGGRFGRAVEHAIDQPRPFHRLGVEHQGGAVIGQRLGRTAGPIEQDSTIGEGRRQHPPGGRGRRRVVPLSASRSARRRRVRPPPFRPPASARWPAPSRRPDDPAVFPAPRRSARPPRPNRRRRVGCRPGGSRSRRAGPAVYQRTPVHPTASTTSATASAVAKRPTRASWSVP